MQAGDLFSDAREISGVATHDPHAHALPLLDVLCVKGVAGIRRVEIFDEIHGALDVGKERGDGFALAVCGAACFHSRLLSQNTFGQMPRGVENWSRV